MAAVNLSAVLATASGVASVYIKLHDANWGTKKLEALKVPEGDFDTGGEWDLLGKFEAGSFSSTGEEASIEEKKFTDGSVAVSLPKRGTVGFDAKLLNISTAICKTILRMEEKALTAGGTGIMSERTVLLSGKENPTIKASVLIRFNNSTAWHSVLFPNLSITSRFLIGGNEEDLSTIEIKASAAAAPASFQAGAASPDLTTHYIGAEFVLVPKTV